jgi:hypothetical protein
MWLPGSSVENPPDLIQNELFNSPASSEGWISLNGKMLAAHPGQYILTVSAFSGMRLAYGALQHAVSSRIGNSCVVVM